MRHFIPWMVEIEIHVLLAPRKEAMVESLGCLRWGLMRNQGFLGAVFGFQPFADFVRPQYLDVGAVASPMNMKVSFIGIPTIYFCF